MSPAERLEGFGDYEAGRTCVGANARRDRLWRRTSSSECCVTHRLPSVNTILPVGEFTQGSAAGSSISMWCYRLGPELLSQLLLIRLFQQTHSDSMSECLGQRFQRPCGNFNRSLQRSRPASSILPTAAGRMASCARNVETAGLKPRSTPSLSGRIRISTQPAEGANGSLSKRFSVLALVTNRPSMRR